MKRLKMILLGLMLTAIGGLALRCEAKAATLDKFDESGLFLSRYI